MPIDKIIRNAAIILLFMVELSAIGHIAIQPLEPESTMCVTRSDNSYTLTHAECVPTSRGRLVFEAETHACYPNEGYRKDEDLSGGAGVEDLVGRYFVRVKEEGIYTFWARVKAPWAGTWAFSLTMDPPGTTDDVAPKSGLSARSDSAVEEGPTNRLNGTLNVAEGQVGKAVYILGGRLKLASGRYLMRLEIPNKIITDQLILVPGEIEDPEKSLRTSDGKIPPPSLARAEEGEILFRSVFPLTLESYAVLRAENSEQAENCKWLYRFPLRPDTDWQLLPADGNLSKLPVNGDGQDALQVKLLLRSSPAGDTPKVGNPVIEFVEDASREIELKTRCGIFHVSRVSGYWGAISSSLAGGTRIRPTSTASLPFYISTLGDGDISFTELKNFHAVRVNYVPGRNRWDYTADFTEAETGIQVTLTAAWRGGDVVTWKATIENNSRNTVCKFHFPVLTDIQIGENHADDNIAWLGHLREPMTSLEGWLRSSPGALTYFDLYDSAAAFYLGDHDASMLDGTFFLRPYGMTPPFNYWLEKRPTILPGDSWESGKYVLAVHDGDWHKAADEFYRPWYDNEIPKPANPEWLVKHFSGWGQPVRYQSNPTLLPSAWQINHFLGWQYLKSFVTEWPGPDLIPTQGGFPAVQRNARWIEKRGGQVDSYTDCNQCCLYHNSDFQLRMKTPTLQYRDLPSPSLEWKLRHQVIPLNKRDLPLKVYADPERRLWPQQPFDYMLDNADKASHDYWEEVARHYAMAGMNIYWDEAGNASAPHSFKPLDMFVRPGYGWSLYGRTLCARRMIDAARKIKPDFILVGENYNDRVMSAVNLAYLQDAGSNPHWSEVIRYTHPNHILPAVIIKNQELLNKAFLMHSRICSSDIFNGPWGSSWFRARVFLREPTKDAGNLGTYRDNVGLSVSGNGSDARYTVLREKTKTLWAINTYNPTGIEDGVLTLRDKGVTDIVAAFVYTMEGRVRSASFDIAGGIIKTALPKEELATVLLCAGQEKSHNLRVFAMMPMLESYPPKIRVALANPGKKTIAGTLHVGPSEPLLFEAAQQPFDLKGGEALTVDLVFTNRDQLTDFIDLPVTVRSGKHEQKIRVAVAPTIPNGGFELDVADNSIADHWIQGLRDFAEPAKGSYCLALPPKSPYFNAENMVFLLPRTRYRLQLFYRYSGKRTPHAQILFFSENNKLVDQKHLPLPTNWPFKWREVSLEFDTPQDWTGKAYARLCNPDDNPSGLTAWVDDVRLIEMGATTEAQ